MMNIKISWWGIYVLTAFILGCVKVNIGNGDVYFIDIFSALTFFYVVTNIPNSIRTKSFIFIISYTLICCLIAVNSSIRHGVQLPTIVGMVRYFEYLIWGVAFFIKYQHNYDTGKVPIEIKILYIFLLAVSILQFFGFTVFLESWQEFNFKYGDGFRAPGVFLHPNINSFFLSFFPILYFYGRRENIRIQMLVAFIIVVALVLTNSRGNFAIASIAFVMLYVRGIKITLLAVFAVLGVIGISSYIDYSGLAGWLRLDSSYSLTDNTSFTLRLQLWESALKMFYQSPILGQGFKQFPVLTDVFIWGDSGNGVEEVKTHANSFILGSLAENGLVFTLLILYRMKKILAEYGTMFFSLFVFILMYDDLFHDPYSMTLLLFMAISLTRYKLDEK
ncbi:O-antigen ligase family protein [Serratia liquefaciens]|uniref:O-antigen ligase family protein n=1 Tax=Serratia liquefaciens TaxID=614 RepID=UPI0009DBA454|nr:O-antigen ligase family protein [Serratia liquefaciens]CAI0912646.1 Lipid A core - O-antigen ligase and related enzymes [Serratia liquefaciens]CAI2119769.1 Lipid A core - O-antigen ligase and related enzymes [Serratia liquefaciens]CAI2473026.1 Lipid A core - O-antigen ligase and related enzymes [Serratia liquefaciens]HEJ7995214.1 O-antigen ligase family protein [Serratia liquefaciens]